MKNCVGQAVRGNDFWDRNSEISIIWNKIDSGSHILLAAPRRVGKTSIMFNLLDNPKDDYIVMYIDTESADNENEFWQKLFNALQEEDFVNKLKSYSNTLFEKIKNIRIDKISTSGVTFGDGETLDYSEAFEKMIKDLDTNKKLIIMIDEFAQTVENIIKYEDTISAIKFIKRHRELRQNQKISSKVSFIYAGSIGLESVVSKLNGMKHINDLNSIKVNPLSFIESKQFISVLVSNLELKLDDTVINEFLKRVEWYIPFYIQLIIQEIKTITIEDNVNEVTVEILDKAINNALNHRNHFEHWRSKLKEALGINEFKFTKEMLNHISENNIMESLDIINIGVKYDLDDDEVKEIIHSLIHDGYINNNDNPKEYRFNSPILKMWWYKNVAN
ncbi:AAA family ATPase [Arcobacter roscoffensis]|uniref:AAA family ATPase n=1 Tax=Arcobacter roscoffensis TaxID=2961520 RepID=A0ABY5E6P1_9BACT|nr:AAA family ATPase [Arcobacter roscoffensis]UTJ07819.1 AAA family ATPase [Arcobacter roscoffensis]